ncbi:MAG: sensor histidine kinase [Micrococcales bacterium]|nr:sensor histidine kinase [Micrococcales bacterium]
MTTVTLPAPAARPGFGRRWAQGWWHLVYLGLSPLMSMASLTVVVLVLTGVASAPGFLLGVVLLVPGLYLADWLASVERSRLASLTGREVLAPERQQGLPWWRTVFLDVVRWRAAGYSALQMFWGLFSGILAVTLAAAALSMMVVSVTAGALPDNGVQILGMPVSSFTGRATLGMVGTLLGFALPLIARALTAVDGNLARWLIGVDQEHQIARLSERVTTLTGSREAAVDSVEAERRRIERDLHDGPQQRLVALAMDLGMARTALDRDPEAARRLLDSAHSSAKEAITEMRQVARGITPPILTDRGLDAALSALAGRSPVPVRVEVRGIDRLDPTTEAIAYFCVSEALTNIAKHAQASSAVVDVSRQPGATGERVLITVSDNGIGGADPLQGTGLTGLRQRVAAVDGDLMISSPHGGPTTLTVSLPLRDRRPA